MNAEDGQYLYRITTAAAGALTALVVLSYFFNATRGMPVISAAALALAGVIWLIGWAGRHVLAGR